MTFRNITAIRYFTFIVGLVLATLMTAQLLSTSSSSVEFWTELKTGTGWSFFVYALPYVVYLYSSSRLSRSQQVGILSALIIAIGIIMNVSLSYGHKSIQSADVAIIDPSVYFVLAQVALAVVLPIFFKRK